MFSIEKIAHSNTLIKLHTGLPSYEHFEWLYNEVREQAANMHYYRGPSSSHVKQYELKGAKKPGRKRKLSIKNELLLTLVRLRLNLLEADLALRFNISESSVSTTLSTWIPFLARELEALIHWPARENLHLYNPRCFHKYGLVSAILDCTEVPIERASLALANTKTFSSYKGRCTVKCLVASTPGGTTSFISPIAGGKMSDKEIVKRSGILDKFEPGDVVMADRGFNIQDLLLAKETKLIIPPFTRKGKQFAKGKVVTTKSVANARIHIERTIRRIKEFRILRGEIPLSMKDIIEDIFIVCGALINLQKPLVPLERPVQPPQ